MLIYSYKHNDNFENKTWVNLVFCIYLWISDEPAEWRRLRQNIIFFGVLCYLGWIDECPGRQWFIQIDYFLFSGSFFLFEKEKKIINFDRIISFQKSSVTLEWLRYHYHYDKKKILTVFWYCIVWASDWSHWNDRFSA